MSNFKQNTVETVGDAALAESIINRSITELQDNITTSIAAQKFRGCSALANVIFPSVTSVGIGAFWQCTALKQADFTACVSFAQNAFYGCSALKALILRCTDAVCTLTGNLSGTPIATGTGYIYVPLALVDTYKAATGWSTYAAQIRAIEDYPEVCATYTWEAVFKAIDAGTYKDVYAVGDLVPLDLGTQGVVNMQIAAFDADDLADGTGKASISWISKELTMKTYTIGNAYTAGVEGTGALGGWAKCSGRSRLNDIIYPLITEYVRSKIKTVKKYTKSFDASGNAVNDEVTDEVLWIPSEREIKGTTETMGATYTDLFADSESLIKYAVGENTAGKWWLRTASSSSRFRVVDVQGSLSNASVNTGAGYALGFCT